MKKVFFSLSLIAVCLLTLCGCQKKAKLHIYDWADYVAPELIAQFEKENNCRIVYDTFDSNEGLLAKMEAGATGYDLIVPSHYIVENLQKSGLIKKIDHSRLNFLQDLDMEMLQGIPDIKCEYSIPYMLSYTGIGYNKKMVPDFKPSWSMFARTDLQKRATLLDDKREVIGAALLHLGYNPNSLDPEELAKAKELSCAWKKNVTKFENELYKNGIISSEFYLIMGFSGDMMQAVNENPDLIGFALPEEGAIISADVFCIPTSARNEDLAYKFLNFLYETNNAVKNVEYLCFGCPLKSVYPLLPEEIRNNPAIFMPPEVRAKSHFIIDHGKDEEIINRLWAEIQAAD